MKPLLSFVPVLAAVAGLAACGPGRPPPPARHVVLVTIDTLRADRVGVYGAEEVSTPNLDRLAAEGAMAANAVVHVPLTRPSHASLFTGKLPTEHGIRDNVSPSIGADETLLAEVMRSNGFETAGFVSSVVLAAQSGLDRGFDHYSDDFEGGADDARFLNTVQKKGDTTVEEAVDWLREHREDERLFTWIHLYDPHDPYQAPEPFASRFLSHPYDAEVAWTDELIGRLDRALDELGLADETLLVVTSDHGEGLGEHQEQLHGFFVYDTTLAVPLIFRGPGIPAGSRLDVTVRTIDLFPTISRLAGIAPPDVTGRDLSAALYGQETLEEEPAYAESLVPLLHFGWSDLRSIREGVWKYIEAPRPELYNLEEDPEETENLVSTHAGTASRMRERLGEILSAERAVSSEGSVPAELLEQLGALGYLGAGSRGIEPTGEDPKDKVDEFRIANALMREGLVRFNEKDLAASVRYFEELLERDIESFEVYYYLARALLASERYSDAATHFESAIARHPTYAAAYEGLASARAALGEPLIAIDALRSGQETLPADAGLVLREARLWRQLDRPREARVAYERGLPLAPDDGLARVQLGELLRDLGDTDEAIRYLREAVSIAPEEASYWNSLGMVLGGQEAWNDAGEAFERAVELDGDNAMYTFNLGLVSLRQGHLEKAKRWFEITLDLDAGFEAARQQLDRLDS